MAIFDHERICKGCEFYGSKDYRPVCTNSKKIKSYEYIMDNGMYWSPMCRDHIYLDGDKPDKKCIDIHDFLGEDNDTNVRLKKVK